MQSAEIRRRFVEHFERRGHTVVPSAPLPLDDPTLLFVNAGMVPFKPYFLGQRTPPFPRAVSVQKCVRTLDIDEVGRTTRHGTFFQMAGNFSFGDYFKEGAIELAWDLVTRPQSEGGYGFAERDLYASVYAEDDEAVALWKRVAGLADDRIVRLGMKDNFWSMGVPGPCGPCSEILIDRGPEFGADGDWDAGDRYLEFWNLVFMQNIRGEGAGKEGYPILGDLPAKNIDTGMGLERVAYLLQGVDNLYEIDEVYPVLERAAEMSGAKYGADPAADVRLRVVADHVRTGLMLLADGVTPSNEGRGYVLRRILRRTARAMRLLGVDTATLPELLPVSREAMGASYPEVARDFERISTYAYAEEDSFLRTLRAGTQIFDVAVDEVRRAGGAQLPGDKAFQLHDTYGFPIDITLEMAAEQGLRVDEDGFRRLMREQRERAKADASAKKTGHADLSVYRRAADRVGGATTFTGYDEVAGEGTVRAIVAGGVLVPAARAGDEVEVVLDRTPFYAEGGGQLPDAGRIELGDGALLEVRDVQSPVPGLVVHRGTVVAGEVVEGAAAFSRVDVARRRAISRAHTATHLTHKAFREALGDTATQAGSENAPGRFRFDFAAPAAVPPSVLRDVEQKVNEVLADDLEVSAEVMSQARAQAVGAMALFGEKYGDEVRVVSVGDWARELCGGTHAQRAGQLGVVTLLHEASIGAGVRRVEALVGADAWAFLAREHALVNALTDTLKVRPEELPERVAGLLGRLRDAERELDRQRSAQVLRAAADLAAGRHDVFGVDVVTAQLPDGAGADDLRRLALDVRGRLGSERPAVVAVAGTTGGRPLVVVAVNDTARSWRLHAGVLVKEAAAVLGGGGGGKDDVAQGGGADPTKVAEALARVEHAVGEQVTR